MGIGRLQELDCSSPRMYPCPLSHENPLHPYHYKGGTGASSPSIHEAMMAAIGLHREESAGQQAGTHPCRQGK